MLKLIIIGLTLSHEAPASRAAADIPAEPSKPAQVHNGYG
jgi:hypothetical protein